MFIYVYNIEISKRGKKKKNKKTKFPIIEPKTSKTIEKKKVLIRIL